MKKSPKSLVIVESPAKIKTLTKILGEGYEIRSSYGHIRDLPKNRFGLKIEKEVLADYRIIPGRPAKIVKELAKSARQAERVYLASDPDREGEAIAWHLVQALSLPEDKFLRVSFNEITAPAVKFAFQHPRKISLDMVNAQQARRFLDRIVGYKLSPLLWKKIARGLSAGRVQSVAVKLLVEREKEIAQFKPREYWKIIGTFSLPSREVGFSAELKRLDDNEIDSQTDLIHQKIRIPNETQAQRLVAQLNQASYRISQLTRREKATPPPPPFTTSLLQQQASIQLGFSTKKTMLIAQQLYEGVQIAGEPTALITYMRTDSFRVSQVAINECRNFISKHLGEDLLNKTPRHYKSKKSAQEAHEAIRPTYLEKTPEGIKDYLSPDQYKLYRLIWRRFVATQMNPAVWEYTNVEVSGTLPEGKFTLEDETDKIEATTAVFTASARKLISAGYLTVYDQVDNQEEKTNGEELSGSEILNELKENELLTRQTFTPTQSFTKPPERYTEASLVRTLEKYGIGRPSTYAPIISTILERGYIRKNGRQLEATELGILVTDKLLPYFTDILNTRFTSQMEEKLDEIEEGKGDWLRTLKAFYRLFSRDLAKATSEMTSEKGRETVSDKKCSKCGKPLVIRWGRYGKFLACSGYPECKTVVSLKPPAPVKPTGEACEKCGRPMVVRIGRHRRRFLGCSGYPECKNTKSLPFRTDEPKD